jgi:hypothetical protein
MKTLRRFAPLFAFATAFATLALVACAAPAEDDTGEAEGAAKTASKKDGGAKSSSNTSSGSSGEGTPDAAPDAAPEELIMTGRYTNFAAKSFLFIQGRGKEDNQLARISGGVIAYGDLRANGRTLNVASVPDEISCGGTYDLQQVPGRTTVEVTWQPDEKNPSLYQDADFVKGCKFYDGVYEM